MTVLATQNNPAMRIRPMRKRGLVKPEQVSLPPWVHPDVVYWYPEWKMIRDCIEGEKAIKAEANRYLPKFEGMEPADYDAYLCGATFYNFTGRTVKAMVGSIFKRRPVVTDLPEKLQTALQRITRVNNSFNTFCKFATREILSLGRFGTLVDYPANAGTDLKPYVTSYLAENILDWEENVDPVSGRLVLTSVTLREFELARSDLGATLYLARYRKLFLTATADGKLNYYQQFYTKPGADATLAPEDAQPAVLIQRRGEALGYIPFRIFGALMSEAAVETPPLLDIAQLNISHYRSYAHLEHGLFYTGFPIYAVSGETSDEDTVYELGPMKVWKLPLNGKAQVLEMNGHGLKFLENSLDIKEAQAASLGGRMIGVTTRSVSESDNQAALKQRNEVSLLLDVSQALDEGFTTVIRWWAWMAGTSKEDAEKIEVEFNKDFLLDVSGAREYRAIAQMYLDGVLPIEVVYDYMRKNEVIPDWMSVEEFTKLLTSKASFPNQPDFEARAAGFPDAQSEIDQDRLDSDDKVAAEAADAAAKSAEKIAKDNAKQAAKAVVKPGMPGMPGGAPRPAAKAPAAKPKPKA